MTLYSISFWMRKEKQLLFTLKNQQFWAQKKHRNYPVLKS